MHLLGAAVIVALTLQCEAFRQRVTTLGRSVAERARGRASGLKMVQLLSQENARKDVFLYNTEKREKENEKVMLQYDDHHRLIHLCQYDDHIAFLVQVVNLGEVVRSNR